MHQLTWRCKSEVACVWQRALLPVRAIKRVRNECSFSRGGMFWQEAMLKNSGLAKPDRVDASVCGCRGGRAVRTTAVGVS